MLNPATARLWVSVLRDLVILAVASFIAVYETVAVHEPNIYLLGLAGTLFGVPAALNLDALYRRGSEGHDAA